MLRHKTKKNIRLSTYLKFGGFATSDMVKQAIFLLKISQTIIRLEIVRVVTSKLVFSPGVTPIKMFHGRL